MYSVFSMRLPRKRELHAEARDSCASQGLSFSETVQGCPFRSLGFAVGWAWTERLRGGGRAHRLMREGLLHSPSADHLRGPGRLRAPSASASPGLNPSV